MSLAAENSVSTIAKLWSQSGLRAPEAQGLISFIPALSPLLQPITHEKETIAYMLSQPLLAAHSNLSNPGEWQLALLALNPDIRKHWLGLAAARCREAGHIADPQVLTKLITHLCNASEWVLPYLTESSQPPSLSEGGLAGLERELLGASLSENSATPALCRVLRAAFTLEKHAEVLTAIPAVDVSGSDFLGNWCSGRLLALPAVTDISNRSLRNQWLLLGRSNLSHLVSGSIEHLAAKPWSLLLGLLVFTQDAWAAEQRGGLLLTLDSGQNPFAPSEISVVMQGEEGDEVTITCLAGLLLALLSDIQISLYPKTPDTAELNRQLSGLIGEALSYKQWLFKPGSRGETGQYRIHPDFSDACYSLPLSPLFGRKSKTFQHSLKRCALALRETALSKKSQGTEQ